MEGRAEIRMLTDAEEKAGTMPLYRQAFQDPEDFISFYYEVICRNNRIAVMEEEGKITSMAHLNPYTMMVDGLPYKVYYIVAVATRREKRGQGRMREVLRYALERMREEKIPFCYLMPVDVRLYEGLGFEVVCGFDRNRDRAMDEIEGRYDIYCLRDGKYLRNREAERKMVHQETGTAQDKFLEQAVIMAKIVDREAFATMSGLGREVSENQMLEWLRGRRIYICEEV